MAHASVISLKHTIERLQNTSRISILAPSRDFAEFAYKEVHSLQQVLEELDRGSNSNIERVNALEGEIREAVCKLEDALESHVSNQILLQSEESLGDDHSHQFSFSLDLQELKQETDSFSQKVNKLKEKYIKELSKPLPEEVNDDALSSRIDCGGKESKMVGLSDDYGKIKDLLIDTSSYGCITASLVGMAGIGKTTLAKEIFEDPLILSRFDCRAWVTVGPKYRFKDTLKCILAQVNSATEEMLKKEDERSLANMMSKSLSGRKYLIVLDDVWNKQVWIDFRKLLPNHRSRNVVLLTTRLQEVAKDAKSFYTNFGIFNMRLLNKEESWYLLCEKVFGGESCPPQLERAGKKIAKNCEGLPLLIVTVACLLSKAEMTPEYWNKVAEKENSVFIDAYDEMSTVLHPSYWYLPQHLKACFLYMGVFPQNYVISRSKLIKLWSAEGLLEPRSSRTNIEHFATECLDDLVSRSTVMVHKRSSTQSTFVPLIKSCSLHSTFRHLCIREAAKSKFFQVLNSAADGLAEGIENQRRLCIQNNILFGIEDVYNSMASISTVRSLLCTGPPHRYPVPICFGLRLLKVMDALTARFYEFPMEILKLFQLRYLAITYDGKLPPSISKLWNLEYLIVRRHLSINLSRDFRYLPVEIWDMKELKHLQVMGSDLPDPNGALLPNLLIVLDVSARSCTKEIFEGIPNLQKLGIQIELAPEDAVENFSCFKHISNLHRLESLKCVVMNPNLSSEVIIPSSPLSVLPSGLKKLTLSGFGYPWEEMNKLASLPNLKVLKLRCYAFRGRIWKAPDKGFPWLEFLLIEDTDLVHWESGDDSFQFLKCLRIKHCYKLEEIPRKRIRPFLEKVELVDCNPLAMTCAKQIKEIWYKEYGSYVALSPYQPLDVNVHSSWNDGKLK